MELIYVTPSVMGTMLKDKFIIFLSIKIKVINFCCLSNLQLEITFLQY